MQNGGPDRRPPLRPLHFAVELGPSRIRNRSARLHHSARSGFGAAQRFQHCDKRQEMNHPPANLSSNNFLYDNHVPAFLQSRVLVVVLLFSVLTFGQQSGESSSRAHSKPTQQSKTESNLGALADGIYRNASFGFSYKLPFGWVDRTADMREGDDPGKLLLLAVFERPPEATGSTINSAVVIAAEKVSSFSGLKTASDYFGPITELATAKGFTVLNEPHEFVVGTKRLVRGDFSKQRASLTMYQTSLVTLEKSYAVSFTFIGGSQDEIEELIEKLTFSPSKPAHSP